jgi:hypothetical protein
MEEKLYMAEKLVDEVYQEIYPDTVNPGTVAEQDYFDNLSETYAEITDDLQKLHTFVSEANL